MADELLPYFEKELAFIRQMGAEFAKEHPKIAGRLGLLSDTVEDPHTSRLIESFAYLNARIQHKLNDDFPELTDALLGVLFPHYQCPIPSMSIVQFEGSPEQLDAPYAVPVGTLIETETFKGEACRFSTVYPVTLCPLKVTHASLIGRPFATPGSSQVKGAVSVLKLSLETFTDALPMSKAAPKRLRFYLKGQSLYAYPFYKMLMSGCLDVVIASSESDPQPIRLGKNSLRSVGFSPDEGLLPYPPNASIAYRLLTEFFIFPEKFIFFDLVLEDHLKDLKGRHLDVYCYFDDTDLELEHHLNADFFALGCTPMVNLFSHKSDPIKLDHTQTEYFVISDARRPAGFEIYTIDQVVGTTSAGDATEYLPFYGLTHKENSDQKQVYWFSQRRAAKLGHRERDDGTDMYLSLVDLNFNPNLPLDRTLIVQTTCSNRDLPAKLPFNLDHPRLQALNCAPPCSRIRCITQPTPSVRPPLKNRARWRLISHLNLNILSISGKGNSTEAFKEILRLYDFKETSVTRGVIESIQAVNTKTISAPLTVDGRATLCRGLEIEVVLDEKLLTGSSSFLFAGILEQFFALYCPINSFTRTLIKLKGREGYLKKCPPRSGEKILL